MFVSSTAALVGTFLLLVVALVVFVVVFVRSSRPARDDDRAVRHSSGTKTAGKLDTNLDGLDITVAEDSPSAALLAPLRESEWMPPDTPAPAEHLPKVHLDNRIAEYEHPVHVDEPSFAVDSYPSWQVEGTDSGQHVSSNEPDWAPTVPEVRPSAPDSAPRTDDADDRFGAEIAALLPDIPPELAPIAIGALGAHAEPRVVREPAPEPAPAPEPQHAPAPATWLPPDTGVPPTPAPEVATAAADPSVAQNAELGDAFWEGLLAEQQGTAVTGTIAAASVVAVSTTTPQSRPAVKVTSAEPPAPADPPSPAVSSAEARPRATVRVNPIPEGLSSGAPADRSASNAARTTMGRPSSADVPELVLETPVEMWFGDARVGVKPGSATGERFLKYADVLFTDLKESRTRADNS